MKKLLLASIFFVLSVILTGCLYPKEKLKQNEIPYEDQLISVQRAVDEFKKDNNGLLPIKTKDASTPIYEKYPIDFNKISPRYIQEPPGNAYESGGVFQYILIDADDNPKVKLVDLRAIEVIRDINLNLMIYRQKNKYPPYKEAIGDGYYSLDYKKLGFKEKPVVVSPYSNKSLSLFIDMNGVIHIDYAPDLYEALQKNKHSFKNGDDIRSILVEHSPFAPVKSVPYTIENNDPVFLVQKK